MSKGNPIGKWPGTRKLFLVLGVDKSSNVETRESWVKARSEKEAKRLYKETFSDTKFKLVHAIPIPKGKADQAVYYKGLPLIGFYGTGADKDTILLK